MVNLKYGETFFDGEHGRHYYDFKEDLDYNTVKPRELQDELKRFFNYYERTGIHTSNPTVLKFFRHIERIMKNSHYIFETSTIILLDRRFLR